jgi:hypothetical protein
MTKTIKALCKQYGVKNSVRKYSGSIYVTFLSCPNDDLIKAIKALETVEAHGDLMDDTRWYSGTAIHLRYRFEPSPADVGIFEAIKESYAEHSYHFKKAVVEKMGPAGQNILDNYWPLKRWALLVRT